MTDINLDEAPKITRRELLEQAYSELGAVVWYGLHDIKDKIDRDHLKKAHQLLTIALKEKPKQGRASWAPVDPSVSLYFGPDELIVPHDETTEETET